MAHAEGIGQLVIKLPQLSESRIDYLVGLVDGLLMNESDSKQKSKEKETH